MYVSLHVYVYVCVSLCVCMYVRVYDCGGYEGQRTTLGVVSQTMSTLFYCILFLLYVYKCVACMCV